MDLKVHQPTDEDRQRAVEQTTRQRAINVENDTERLAAERRTRAISDQVQAEKDAKRRRCEGYQTEMKRLESTKDQWISPALRQRDYDRMKELKDKHFSECFAR
ncbi:hypothetical protein dqs_0600 [Azoarcus olearius]|nr:hypothetical protein dqs_0600 [Azoarcus olearius]